jgi:NAD(P)H dehydrogenase (quinone)
VLVVATSGRDGYGAGGLGAGPPDDGIIRIDAAAAGGADRIVYATFASETWWEHPGESTLDSTGLRYTILRHNLHSESLLPAFAVAREHGEFVCAFGNGLLAPAARSDCAEATAVVLTGDGHDFQRYQLGGPIGLKPLGIASVMSRLADRQITAREVAPAELVDELGRAGAPAGTAAELARLHGIIRSGGTGTPGTVLPTLLGRYPLSLEEALRARLGEGGRRALPDRPGPPPGHGPRHHARHSAYSPRRAE